MGARRLAWIPLALLPALALAYFGGVLPAPRSAQPPALDDWDDALAQHAHGADRAALRSVERYVSSLSGAQPVSPADAEALWLNAYDALALRTLLGAGGPPGRLRRAVWPHAIAGKWITLDGIERRLRASGDPRVYFALTRLGPQDPPLPEAGFRGAMLDVQLNASARAYLADPRNVQLRDGALHLAPLFQGELKAMAERDTSQSLLQLVWTFLPRQCPDYPGCATRAELDRVCGAHLDACPVVFDAHAARR